MAPDRKRRRLSGSDSQSSQTMVSPPADQAVAQSHAEAANPQSKSGSLFVRSLPASATTKSLLEYFSQSYPIKHATAIIDPVTKLCRGYGFVTFADAEDAENAREELNGSTFEGRKMKLEVAEPRHREMEETHTGQRSRKGVPSPAALEAKAKREAEKASIAPPPKLIIRNLPWSIKEPEQLAHLFRSYGKVKHATIPSKKPGLQAGFGFVVLRGRKNAEKALKGVNGIEIDGRTLAVDWAVDKETWQNQEGLSKATEHMNGDRVDGESDADSMVSDDGARNSGMDEHIMEDASEGSEEDSQEDDEDEDEDDDEDDLESDFESEDKSTTLFIRNLPFTATDETLHAHFTHFGPVRYARVVLDPNTARPKGTGFVSFYNLPDAKQCLRAAPKESVAPIDVKLKKGPTASNTRSVLQNVDSDPTGKYTMDGRVVQVSQAVNKSEATKLEEHGIAHRNTRDKDKRRLYLLSEGTISSKSALYDMLSPSEIAMREASLKQRKTLIQSNPSLHLSLTRLSIRNLSRSVTSKDLKALARQAVVEFAKDVKAGKRQRLSKEELMRGSETMAEAERERKKKGVGIVKQAKVVFEGREGGKVAESSGAGRSRGYGFIEYHSHRSALMGLRWLNGHAIDPKTNTNSKGRASEEELKDRKKRLIVEFAIENAQVVNRRKDREQNSRSRPRDGNKSSSKGTSRGPEANVRGSVQDKSLGQTIQGEQLSLKRKLQDDTASGELDQKDKDKLAKRQMIIERKRMARRTRHKAKSAKTA